MDVEIHPNAKKHLTEKQVLSAWLAVTECIRRESKDEPPRWLAIGWPQTDEAWSLSRSSLSVGGLSFMPCLQSRRNFGRRLNGLGKEVDDGQDVCGR